MAPYSGVRGSKYNVTVTMDAEESSQYPDGLEYPLEDPEDVKASGD